MVGQKMDSDLSHHKAKERNPCSDSDKSSTLYSKRHWLHSRMILEYWWTKCEHTQFIECLFGPLKHQSWSMGLLAIVGNYKSVTFSPLRYQFLEEAFQNQKGIIESSMAKLQEKKNYVHYSVSQVQSRCEFPSPASVLPVDVIYPW